MDKNEAIEKCRLFSGISKEQTEKLLVCLGAKEETYEKGQTVLSPFTKCNKTAIVLYGKVYAERYDVNGNKTILSVLEEGDVFGEAISNSESKSSDIAVIAQSKVSVLWICPECITESSAYTIAFFKNLTHILASKLLSFNERIFILSKKSVRDRICTYLYMQAKLGTVFTVALDRNGMADYLGVERSALSRELSKMKSDGLIDYHKSSFKLSDKFQKQYQNNCRFNDRDDGYDPVE